MFHGWFYLHKATHFVFQRLSNFEIKVNNVFKILLPHLLKEFLVETMFQVWCVENGNSVTNYCMYRQDQVKLLEAALVWAFRDAQHRD